MIAFNNKLIKKSLIESVVVKELAENAAEAREKKRQIKSEWKKCIQRREHMAQFANPGANGLIEPHLFLKLNSNNKYHQKKKLVLKQAQLRHYQATGKTALSGISNLSHVIPAVISHQLEDKQDRFAEKPTLTTQLSNFKPSQVSTIKNIQACQITEIEPAIYEFSSKHIDVDSKNALISKQKEAIKRDLDQKFPTYNFTSIEKDCYAFLHSMVEADDESNQKSPLKPSKIEAEVTQFLQKKEGTEPVKKSTDHQLQEWVISQNYANLNNESSKSQLKRKRYWGELEDCSTAHQIQRDELTFKKAKIYTAESKAIFNLYRDDKLPVKEQPIDNYEEYCSVKQREYNDIPIQKPMIIKFLKIIYNNV